MWNFKENANVKDAFKRICLLMSNLNNSAVVRFLNSKASVVMGIGYETWNLLGLKQPLPKDAESVVEVHGFRYWDGRSILGFVDGTENPNGQDREYFGIIGDEDSDYKGYS